MIFFFFINARQRQRSCIRPDVFLQTMKFQRAVPRKPNDTLAENATASSLLLSNFYRSHLSANGQIQAVRPSDFSIKWREKPDQHRYSSCQFLTPTMNWKLDTAKKHPTAMQIHQILPCPLFLWIWLLQVVKNRWNNTEISIPDSAAVHFNSREIPFWALLSLRERFLYSF